MKTPLLKKTLPQEVRRALSKRSELLDDRVQTCVVVPDATRPLPFEAALRPLFEELARRNIPTTVIVGLGLHRPMTDGELAPLREAIGALPIDLVQHDARANLTDLGNAENLPASAPKNLSISLNHHVVRAKRIICVGTVEPHQYAGFSGGIKAISIGCAGKDTISAMHGISLLRDPKSTLGLVDKNPFQQTLWRIAAPIRDRQILGLQFVPAPGGGIFALFFDEIRPAFDRACETAAGQFFEECPHQLDWLHLPVPDVKATNFYQASRAATYASLVDRSALRPGGTIVLEASCPEKIGQGAGEKACALAMSRGREVLLEELRARREVQTTGGQQRAYVLARACERNQIALVGAPPIAELAAFGIAQFDTFKEARSSLHLEEKRGRRIGDLFHRIPVISS